MAQECTENSVAISSSTTPNWWDLHHASSIPSWTNNTSPWDQSNPSSNSSCEEDLSMSSASFTNASNHSGLTVESACQLVEPASSNELIGEHASDSQLWSHILLGVGSNDELNNSQDVGENLLEALSSKNTTSMSSGIFGSAACDYFKKMDQTNWEFTNPSSTFNNFEKPLNGSFSETLIGNGRLNKLSNFVSQLSIAPPNPEVNRQFDPLTCNISLSSSVNPHFSQHQNCSDSTPGFQPCYGHDLKVETEYHHEIDQVIPFRRPFNRNGVGFHIGLNNSMAGDHNGKYYYGMADATCTSARNWADSVNFSSRLNKTLIDIQVPKTGLKSINLSECKRQGLQTSSPAGKGNGTTNEGKKKRSTVENSETVFKKAKLESSTVSSLKVQAPKVKISEKITVLQQIVSPFGRTDTASVLYEAIQYIKFLQEQVQLLSNPYLKTTNNSHKDPWGALDRKKKGDGKLDLRSRGLCLIPISCTPQLYHENTGSDYWTPTYRGCLYK